MHPRHAHHDKRIDRNCSSTFTEVSRKIQITRKFSSICTRPSRSNVVYNSRDLQSRTKPASQALHPNGKSVPVRRAVKKPNWQNSHNSQMYFLGNFGCHGNDAVQKDCSVCKKNCFQSVQHLTRGKRHGCLQVFVLSTKDKNQSPRKITGTY
ncbi:unnamed protein product [Ixodes persulcatus]